jgi:hypothetical protein
MFCCRFILSPSK